MTSSCTSIAGSSAEQLTENTAGIFVAPYNSFGPPQLSSPLIGNKWWQWDDPDNYKPVKYNVQVVVYRDIVLDRVKLSFPVIPEEKQDYRYVEYEKASVYFEETIAQLEEELKSYDEPVEYAAFARFPLALYRTALELEKKLRR